MAWDNFILDLFSDIHTEFSMSKPKRNVRVSLKRSTINESRALFFEIFYCDKMVQFSQTEFSEFISVLVSLVENKFINFKNINLSSDYHNIRHMVILDAILQTP